MNKWLQDARDSLAEAEAVCERGEVPLENMYMLAPIIYSERNNTRNESLLSQISEETDEMVQSDWACDPQSREQYRFHFVSSYLFGYVVHGKIPELKYDEIMAYVTNRMDLFTDDYNPE